jgi:hypothetical protein
MLLMSPSASEFSTILLFFPIFALFIAILHQVTLLPWLLLLLLHHSELLLLELLEHFRIEAF